ncbi:hypothetical protein AIN02nite_29550 [Acetobacter indonesiensis]|uniref:Uncharacterized protein n=1 Tax=Acetobacter indonesiensis TaxID=104101 RepID=A0A6N3T9G1_9PROT|nr:hypothetical protein AIN02nite_29550 [Acetobacter indonesiensis]
MHDAAVQSPRASGAYTGQPETILRLIRQRDTVYVRHHSLLLHQSVTKLQNTL